MIVAASSPVLWYLTRGAGAVALILLTTTLVLGILEVERIRWAPRFAVASLHRSVSLIVFALIVVHVLTAVLDTFAPIALRDAVVPFAGAYRPIWVGFGAIAFDLLLVLVITSLARRRLGLRAWRAVHWAAYACWPVALVHALGTGSDVRARWLFVIAVLCAVAVLVAITVRLSRRGIPAGARIGAGAGMALLLFAAVLWLPRGPLRRDWARRAGTPTRLLASSTARRPALARTPTRTGPPADPLARGFDAPIHGTLADGLSANGTQVVDLRLHASRAVIRVRLGGQPTDGGGLLMNKSAVYLGPRADTARYRGRVNYLQGTVMRADVGAPDGRALRLALSLRLLGNEVRGHATATPLGASGP